MQVIDQMFADDLTIDEDCRFTGMVAGNLTVAQGRHVEVKGMVGGNLIIEARAHVVFNGMVAGNIMNHGGSVIGSGLVAGHRRDVA